MYGCALGSCNTVKCQYDIPMEILNGSFCVIMVYFVMKLSIFWTSNRQKVIFDIASKKTLFWWKNKARFKPHVLDGFDWPKWHKLCTILKQRLSCKFKCFKTNMLLARVWSNKPFTIKCIIVDIKASEGFVCFVVRA